MANLKLEHIYKVYPNGTKAVNDISLDIINGEFIVFVGPSGCGKSTTLRMIAGLEDITAGELYIDNQIVNDVEPKDRDIAMVFQNYALYPHMTVYENMAFGLQLRHVPADEIQEKVLWAANILGITDYLDRKPKAMSGGQRQRVALGRSILRDPKVMLLDEPLSNLDAKLRTQMRTEIAKLHQKLKTTFIYVTHDQIEAMTLGDRVVVMKGGRIQQVDTPKNLYNHPANKFVAGFIGTPQMNFFAVTLLKEDQTVKVSIPKANKVLAVDYNQLIKVLPEYFDGKHNIAMGVRCENISLSDETDESALKLKISHFEELGSECLIYGSLDLENEDISANNDGNIIIKVKDVGKLHPGDIVYAKINMAKTYFFDSKTEDTIVPRIPDFNSITASIKNNFINILGNEVLLPPVLKTDDIDGCELRIPTDSLSIAEKGLKATVVESEKISKRFLIHLLAQDRIFFCLSDKPYEANTEVHVALDFTRLTLLKDGVNIFEPLNSLDSFDGIFYNYPTVISKVNDPEFVSFRQDKIDSAKQFIDAKILLENQEYEKNRLAVQDLSEEEKQKNLEKLNQTIKVNQEKIAEIKKESKTLLAQYKAEFKKAKADAKKANDDLFHDKKEKEKAEFQSFKANNTDPDSLKRRSDEYHMFLDNFTSDKENTFNRALGKITMDFESRISAQSGKARREITLIKKENAENKANYKKAINPLQQITKAHEENMRILNADRKNAMERAGLVFFFNISGNYYSMASDIISNKLIQGLGTRVFTKDFRIDMPHDAYKLSDKSNALVCKIEDNLDYGNLIYTKLSFLENNEKKYFYLANTSHMEIGKEVRIEFDISRSQITEKGMNIRLY